MYVYKLTVLYIDRNIYVIFSFMYVEQFYNKKNSYQWHFFLIATLKPKKFEEDTKICYGKIEKDKHIIYLKQNSCGICEGRSINIYIYGV